MRFTDREMDIVRVLWERGPSTVAEVRDALLDDLAYNTVLTMLRLMEEKGQVRREKVGRAHRYAAAVPRREVGRSALRAVAETLFDDSPERVLLGLVEQEGVSRADLERMRALLDRRLREGNGGGDEDEDG
jgi:predicted transcriptional regulator